MDARTYPLIAAEPIALHVSDLEQSRRFFEELLGARTSSEGGEATVLIPIGPPSGGHSGYERSGLRRLRLTTAAVEPALYGLSIELDTRQEVLDLYLLAKLLGYRITALRLGARGLSTTVLDPDGHQIRICARATRAAARPEGRRWARNEPGARDRRRTAEPDRPCAEVAGENAGPSRRGWASAHARDDADRGRGRRRAIGGTLGRA